MKIHQVKEEKTTNRVTMNTCKHKHKPIESILLLLVAWQTLFTCCRGQSNAGVYDFGAGRAGERRGSWTPSDWLAAVLVLMTICLGLALSLGLCYYVRKSHTRKTFASAGGSLNGSESLVARI